MYRVGDENRRHRPVSQFNQLCVSCTTRSACRSRGPPICLVPAAPIVCRMAGCILCCAGAMLPLPPSCIGDNPSSRAPSGSSACLTVDPVRRASASFAARSRLSRSIWSGSALPSANAWRASAVNRAVSSCFPASHSFRLRRLCMIMSPMANAENTPHTTELVSELGVVDVTSCTYPTALSVTML